MRDYKKITETGSLTIPLRLRRELNLNSGDAVVIEKLDNGGFTVKPFTDKCSFCGCTENIKYICGKGICLNCAEKIKKVFEEDKNNE